MIPSLLIANRGEIACRIIRTARAMGIRTVAVYSDADAGALHVRSADEAVHIGPSPARESYLVGEKIIAAAKATDAAAIHPGYGFLSENADFAAAVIDAGLVWVGPSPKSIRAMGLKDAAKTLMAAAGVPVTPGYMGANQDPAFLEQQACEIGFPVLIKAVAGGGGKGMRSVLDRVNFADALASCQREAAASFGNDHVLIEKYIQRPRHIEVQIFGDTHGNIVHLFERDCSLQRRHQKVIEEAPAPGMDEATRAQLCAAAVKAAKAVDYVGAGTIEFIADASEGLRADRIWFMEMNTRLQVEHPVTEEITGVDLVEWQLRVASGEPLPKRQDELAINGWAMEARLYAEDPAKGFLPSTGRLEHLRLPTELYPREWVDHLGECREVERSYGRRTRIDSGVDEGDVISPHYDPMIAKVIWHDEDRTSAALSLSSALQQIEIWPVQHNAQFVASLLESPAFVKRQVHTGFIEQHWSSDRLHTEPGEPECAFAAHELVEMYNQGGPTGFRLNSEATREVLLTVNGKPATGDYRVRYSPSLRSMYNVERAAGPAVFVSAFGYTGRYTASETRGSNAHHATSGAILSPMPGRIIAVDVAAGDAVTKGQRLLTLEAMKMEHSLTAPFDGVVAELNASAGAQVQVEALLVRIEPAA